MWSHIMYIVLRSGETSSPVGIIFRIPPKTILCVHGPWWLRGQPIGWAQVRANGSYEPVGGSQSLQLIPTNTQSPDFFSILNITGSFSDFSPKTSSLSSIFIITNIHQYSHSSSTTSISTGHHPSLTCLLTCLHSPLHPLILSLVSSCMKPGNFWPPPNTSAALDIPIPSNPHVGPPNVGC